jgi:Fur family transcriptional regulator, zinc uptake regulator
MPGTDRKSADAEPSWRRRKRARILPGAQLDTLLLTLLREARVPLSAYALADHLHEHGRHLAMPSIYRSLERLVLDRRIEKVQTLSAFRIRDVAQAVLLVCIQCGRTEAMPASQEQNALIGRITAEGFSVATVAFEVAGRCGECLAQPTRSS